MKIGINKMPPMVRATQLAWILSTTRYDVVKFCETNGIPITRAGTRKIMMIPRDEFFKKR